MFKYKNIFRFSFLVIAFMFIAAVALAQNERLNYQGVARKPDGTPMVNQNITVNLSIPGTAFSALHPVTTNSFGLFNIVVGSLNSPAFEAIDWSTPRSLSVEINSVSMPTSLLNYVPYAFYAKYANQLKGFSLSNTAPSSGQVLKWNGTAWAPGIDNGSVTAELPIKTSLVSGVTNLFIELSNGNILVGDATNKAAAVTMSGDVTLSNTGVATIGSGKVTNTMLAGNINATKLADGSVDNTKLQYINTLASNAQTQLDAKQTSTLSNGNILVGDATNKAAAVTMSGDVTLSNTGVATIANDAVTYAKIQNVSSSDKVLGRVSAGSGNIEEISTTGTGDVVRANSPTLTGNITASGPVAITNTTTSNSTSTGALVVSGGVGIGGDLNVGGVANFNRNLRKENASYTITTSDYYVIFTGTNNSIFTLPTAVGKEGKEYLVKNLSSLAANLTVKTSSSESIIDAGGSNTNVIVGPGANNNSWVKLVSDGTGWIAFKLF